MKSPAGHAPARPNAIAAGCGAPVVGDLELLDGDRPEAREVEARGVDHERGVDALERTSLGQDDLPAAALLGRGPEDHHGAAQLLGHRGRSDAGPDAGRADDVVPARVADAGQGVVLAHDRHPGAGRARRRQERGRDAARTPLDRQALALDHPGQELVGEVLLVVELGSRVHLVRHVEQQVASLVDLGRQARLDVGERGRVHRATLVGGPSG